MLSAVLSARGMVTAPHHLAADAGARVLRHGGNAIEAMIAAAATIAVVYPHMNSIGGDGFWLIKLPGKEPIGIDACGAAAQAASVARYRGLGLDAVPARGVLAANTVAGTVSGWQLASEWAARIGGSMSRQAMLEAAIAHATAGVPITTSQADLTLQKRTELEPVGGFGTVYLPGGKAPERGQVIVQPRLARTLQRLADEGFDGFYRGQLGRAVAADLERAGTLVKSVDLERHRARQVEPLRVRLGADQVFNMPPPTQGLASLLILAQAHRLSLPIAASRPGADFELIHRLVEATKQAFLVRDEYVTDPAQMSVPIESLLSDDRIESMLARISPQRALPWPYRAESGDTVWLGAIDADGVAVSFIQSLYWEFGSGVVLDETGILWQNRGSSFQLHAGAKQELMPGRKPFHTAQSGLRAVRRWPLDGLWHDGRRRPAADASGDFCSLCLAKCAAARGHHRAALVAGPYLGRSKYDAEARVPLC